MSKKYALNLKDPLVTEFIQTKGILKEELLNKKLKDFFEQGISPEIQETRFKYHNDKLQSILIQYRSFISKRNSLTSDQPTIEIPSSDPVHSSVTSTCRTPQTLKLEFSQKNSPTYNSNRSLRFSKSPEQRAEEIQKKIESKLFVLKSAFEKKKLKQLKKLNQLELEREMKNRKILERISRHAENSADKNNSFENNMKKFDVVRKKLEKQELELEKNIKKSLDKIDLKHKLAQKKIELDLISKKMKAKQMTKSINFDKSIVEGVQSEGRLKVLMDKFEKMSENKKRIKSILEFRVKKKKDLEKVKKRKVFKNLKLKEQEVEKKNLDLEKKKIHLEKALKEKIKKMKDLAVHNELEHLNAQTRIKRIHTKMVKDMQSVYQSKLFEEQQNKAKRINEFIESKRGDKSKSGNFYLGKKLAMTLNSPLLD